MFYEAVTTCLVCPLSEPGGWNSSALGCSSLCVNGAIKHTLKESFILLHSGYLIICFVRRFCPEQVLWGWRNSKALFLNILHGPSHSPPSQGGVSGRAFTAICGLDSQDHQEAGPFLKKLPNYPHNWFGQNRHTWINARVSYFFPKDPISTI